MAVKNAQEQALAMLARREHAVAELKRKLLDKGHPFAEVARVVDALAAKGLVDDARYAAARARYRALVSHWGASRIRMELQSVVVDGALIDVAMRTLEEDGVVFADEAKRVAGRRFGGAAGAQEHAGELDGAPLDAAGRAERMKARQKRVAYLVRRGFTYAEAQAAVDED